MSTSQGDPYLEMVGPILSEATGRFLKKSDDYGRAFEDLGLKGQYSDLHRKMFKLRKSMWEGKLLKGESTKEILQDLIGNCLISIYLIEEAEQLDEDAEGKGSWPASSQPFGGQDSGPQGAGTTCS